MMLKGHAAIAYAAAHRGIVTLSKYTDPVEPARDGLTVEEATAIAREDASLIWCDASGAAAERHLGAINWQPGEGLDDAALGLGEEVWGNEPAGVSPRAWTVACEDAVRRIARNLQREHDLRWSLSMSGTR